MTLSQWQRDEIDRRDHSSFRCPWQDSDRPCWADAADTEEIHEDCAAYLAARYWVQVVCMSCGATRRGDEMRPAVDRMWRRIPDAYVCREQDACYAEVVKTARAAGDARRGTVASDDSGLSS